MGNTSIEWTEKTWNCLRGCSRVSPGCVNCYAERIAARFARSDMGPAEWTARSEGKDLPPFFGFATKVNGHPAWTGKVELIEDKLKEPLSWKKPCRVFVNSMSDLFHENLPDEAIDRMFAVMALCPQHTFQILTKRADRMLKWFQGDGRDRWEDHVYRRAYAMSAVHGRSVPAGWPLRNVWLGVSVENQKYADERIPLLLQTPAAVRFVSYEPALGPVDFERIANPGNLAEGQPYIHALRGYAWVTHGEDYYDVCNIDGQLNWIIVGAESGPGARPFEEEWARSIRDQCVAAHTAFFYKQNAVKGHKIPTPELDGKKWMEFPCSL